MYCQPGSVFRVQLAFCLLEYDCSWRVGGVIRVRALRGDLRIQRGYTAKLVYYLSDRQLHVSCTTRPPSFPFLSPPSIYTLFSPYLLHRVHLSFLSFSLSLSLYLSPPSLSLSPSPLSLLLLFLLLSLLTTFFSLLNLWMSTSFLSFPYYYVIHTYAFC